MSGKDFLKAMYVRIDKYFHSYKDTGAFNSLTIQTMNIASPSLFWLSGQKVNISVKKLEGPCPQRQTSMLTTCGGENHLFPNRCGHLKQDIGGHWIIHLYKLIHVRWDFLLKIGIRFVAKVVIASVIFVKPRKVCIIFLKELSLKRFDRTSYQIGGALTRMWPQSSLAGHSSPLRLTLTVMGLLLTIVKTRN